MLPGDWLFPGMNPVSPMVPRQLNRYLHGAAERAGITKPVSLHSTIVATPYKRKDDRAKQHALPTGFMRSLCLR